MSALRAAMEAFPYVFHPITVLGAEILVLIHVEWARLAGVGGPPWRRFAGFLGAGLLSLVPTVAYVLTTGSGTVELTKGNAWQVDALVASGLLVAAGLTWWLWRRYEWGPLVPEAMDILAAVTVPYAALSPVWNVSGHVLIALVPALYLTLVDRRFWPLLSVPVLMVPNRVYLSAHTWAQSVGGFLLADAVVLSVHRLRARGGTAAASDPA